MTLIIDVKGKKKGVRKLENVEKRTGQTDCEAL